MIGALVSAAEKKPLRAVIQVHFTAPLGAGVLLVFAEGTRLHSRCQRCHNVPGGGVGSLFSVWIFVEHCATLLHFDPICGILCNIVQHIPHVEHAEKC